MFSRDLISTVITLAINGQDEDDPMNLDFATCSHRVSEDQRLIRIMCDRTLLTMPRCLLIVIVDRDLIRQL